MRKGILTALVIIVVCFISVMSIGAKMNSEITQVRASHILVQSQQEAQDLKTKIDNGEISFEEAAKKYSSCPSKARGGDLGYFERRVMVKEFEDAAFDAPKGSVTEPVKTQFGWHLIKVIDKK